MRVMCAVAGCFSIYVSGETASDQGPRYVCSKHTDEELREAGILITDRVDQDVHFQDFTFDRDLKKKKNSRYTHPLPERPDVYKSPDLRNENVRIVEEVLANLDEVK